MGLEITIREVGEVTILDLKGRATIGLGNDILNAKLRQVVDGGSKKLLINLAEMTQIDSSGISSLVRTFVTLERSQGALKFLNPAGRVKEVLAVTRLLAAIPTFDAEPAALAAFKS
ncbi:MAG TPA: STAS domain-containing protein [Candidatus Acidoferrales bacterium]|nr:STAS domain-containing protein [Candidatus Acidoferrales bacterium]